MIIIDFFGMPGSGKSTISHKISALLSERGFKVEEPTYASAHVQGNVMHKLNKVCLLMKFFVLHNKRFRSIMKLASDNGYSKLSSLRQTANIILKIQAIEKSTADFLMFDEGLLQSAISLAVNKKNNPNSTADSLYDIVEIKRSDIIPIYVDQDIKTVLNRLELRATNHSRAEQIKDEDERKRLLEDISRLCKSLVSDNTIYVVSDSCKEEDVLSEIVRRSQKYNKVNGVNLNDG